MNPSKVLLITLVGPSGEVDVAVRADLPASELLPAFNELVGMGRGQSTGGGGAEPSSSGRSQRAEGPNPGRPAGQGQAGRDIPLGGTLADAGIVDGTVLYLYRAGNEQ